MIENNSLLGTKRIHILSSNFDYSLRPSFLGQLCRFLGSPRQVALRRGEKVVRCCFGFLLSGLNYPMEEDTVGGLYEPWQVRLRVRAGTLGCINGAPLKARFSAVFSSSWRSASSEKRTY